MALVKCSECKSQMSDTASNCPKCGAPINLKAIENYNKQQSDNLKGCLIIFALIIFGSIIFGAINAGSSDIENQTTSIDTINTTIDSIEQNKITEELRKAEEVEEAKFLKTKAGKIYKKHPEWTKEDCINLSKKQIWVGMSYDMLIYLRGKPNTVNTSNYGNGNEYQCCWDDYNPSCFYMKDDKIITSYN